jgi:hypothetical protein
MVDNASWTAGLGYLDFLSDVGKHFSVNMMVAKDSVRSRMEGEAGISYTEFSYMLLQAHDFYHLRRTLDCELQIGGSDQWGNITAGTDLIRKKLGVALLGPHLPADHEGRRHQVREDRRTARSGSTRQRRARTGSTSSSSTPRTAWCRTT